MICIITTRAITQRGPKTQQSHEDKGLELVHFTLLFAPYSRLCRFWGFCIEILHGRLNAGRDFDPTFLLTLHMSIGLCFHTHAYAWELGTKIFGFLFFLLHLGWRVRFERDALPLIVGHVVCLYRFQQINQRFCDCGLKNLWCELEPLANLPADVVVRLISTHNICSIIFFQAGHLGIDQRLLILSFDNKPPFSPGL